ncbi:MAG: hypothetical protein JW963_20015 [Anaerolineales bacterium]|nr:hypothetical protein [Anaerolineales bacterium]
MKLPSKELLFLYHATLIGASPLIPIPFLDELIAAYLRRRMVAEIAKIHHLELSKKEIRQLANQHDTGCLNSCSTIIILPLKEIFREIFFWLEWRRGIDLATKAYYFGYLLDLTFEQVDFHSEDIPKYRYAIQHSLSGANTRLVRDIIANSFYSSKGLVRTITGWLFQFSRYYLKLMFQFLLQKAKYILTRIRKLGFRKKVQAEPPQQNNYDGKLDDFFEEAPPKISDLALKLAESLSNGIGKIPREHFDNLSKKLILELQR